jgi:hypothetical protein
VIRIKSIGVIELKGFLDLSRILELLELACARLLVCWLNFCGLVAYDLSSIAQGQSANLTDGNTSDSQTGLGLQFTKNS